MKSELLFYLPSIENYILKTRLNLHLKYFNKFLVQVFHNFVSDNLVNQITLMISETQFIGNSKKFYET